MVWEPGRKAKEHADMQELRDNQRRDRVFYLVGTSVSILVVVIMGLINLAAK